METAQSVIIDIYRVPRAGVPDILAEIPRGKPSDLRLMLVFRKAQTYCCVEPGCHLGLHRRDRWDDVIARLRRAEYVISEYSVIRILGMVQAGVILSSPGNPTTSVEKSFEYTEEYRRPNDA